MSAPIKPWESSVMHDRVNTMESVIPAAPGFINSTPSMSINPMVPALPPRPQTTQPIYSAYGGGLSNSYGGFGNSFGGFGNSYGGLGGGYSGAGYMGAGYGSPYGGFNRLGPNGLYGDAESQFIQIAEERSRPAFQSIESVVGAVGSIAMMLENTFIAMTSSFRAILGVAENFGRLRSLFAQFWSTFAVIRSINWMIRKLLVMLGIRTEDEFKAWARAVADTEAHTESGLQAQRTRGSGWPILLFFGIVATAPYIILKLLSGLSTSIQEKLNDPKTWQNPMRAVAQHQFQATSTQELSFRANQLLNLAPQHLQGPLWNSGWLMASVDQKTAGLIPINYVKVIRNSNNVNEHNVSVVENPSSSETSNLLQKENIDINASSNKPLSDIVGDFKPEVSILNEIYSHSSVSEKPDEKHEL